MSLQKEQKTEESVGVFLLQGRRKWRKTVSCFTFQNSSMQREIICSSTNSCFLHIWPFWSIYGYFDSLQSLLYNFVIYFFGIATAEFPNLESTKSIHVFQWKILTQIPADVNVEVNGVVAVVHQVAATHFD